MRPTKLPAGMYLRRGNTYYARIWKPDRNHPRGGRDRWISLGKDLEDAKKKLLRLQLAGAPPDREGNVEQMAEAWLGTYCKAHQSPRVAKKCDGIAREHLIPFLGGIKANRLTSDHLRRYRSHLEGKGLLLATVLHVLSDARCLLNWATDSGWIERSPWPRRLMPKVPESPPKYLSDDDQAKIHKISEPYRLGCLVMLHSGVRFEELCRLQASDLVGDVLTIHGPTKSRRLRRVTLPAWLVAEIRSRVGRLVPFDGVDDLKQFTETVRSETGIEKLTTRAFRHTYAAHHARLGSVEALRQLLGHQSVLTTQRYMKLGEDLVLAESRRVAEAS